MTDSGTARNQESRDTKSLSFIDLSIREMLSGYKEGWLSPEEVTELCIGTVEALDQQFHAFELFDAETLRKQTYELTQRISNKIEVRPLEGMPVGIKDIFNTADFGTEMGSPLWSGFTPGNDARVVFNLKREGAVIPGKTVTAEFAVHALLGKSLNPHNPNHTPGTSSSGSAVAVATGMVPVALGSQTAASIIRPASYCGVYGCKPSFGIIPRTGVLKTTDTLDNLGFFVSRSEDLDRVFDCVRLRGPDYPMIQRMLEDPSKQTKPEGRPWQVGFFKTHTWSQAQSYAQDSLIDWIDRLDQCDGVEVTEVELPDGFNKTHEIHEIIYNKCLAYYFKREFENHTLVSEIMIDLIEKGLKITPDEYRAALAAQESLVAEMDHVLESYDVTVSLSTAGGAPLVGAPEPRDPSLIWTLIYMPTVNVPLFTSPSGLPFGIQIGARRYRDKLLFSFIAELESRRLVPGGANPNFQPRRQTPG